MVRGHGKDRGVSMKNAASRFTQEDFQLLLEYTDRQDTVIHDPLVPLEYRSAGNYLANAEMGMEQNYNQIDGIINNEPPRRAGLTDGQPDDETGEPAPGTHGGNGKPSILDRLHAAREATEETPRGPVRERERRDLEI